VNLLYLSVAQLICFDLTSVEQDPYIPELWANEALERLENTMVMANLVHRDFSDELANFGDVVNTRRPADFEVARKGGADNVRFQTAQSTNVRVPLDQWFSEGFVIKDGDATMSFQELVTKYLDPAADAIANGVDRALLGHVHAYLMNRAGRLGKISSANAGDFLLDAREIMNRNKAPVAGRNLVLSPASETAFLKNDLFVAADKRGDSGTALEAALLGRIYGYDTYMGQNVNSVSSGADIVTGTVTNALAAGGNGSQSVSVSGYEVTNGSGEFVVVDGNDQPTYAIAATASTNTTAVTLNEANRFGTMAGATVTVYKAAAVDGTGDTALANETGGSNYPAGWSREVRIDGHAANKGPQQGQLIAFVTNGIRHTYTVIQARQVTGTVTLVLLDRPLEVELADGQDAFPGPAGSMNWAFHRNAITLVNRPLKVPASREGVNSAVVSYKGLSIRASMQYDISATGTRVHLDMLAGVAILDPNLACILLG
jgi:hypothetical protein